MNQAMLQKTLNEARLLRDCGRFTEAYTRLLQLPWPLEESEPYLLKGVLERHLGLRTEARSSLAMALQHPAHLGLACYELAELERSCGAFDAAASWFLAALRLEPQHSWIHHSLQYTRFSEAVLPEVAAEYRRHLAAHPGDAMALHLLAQLQLRLGQRQEALASSRQAARLNLGDQERWLADAAEPPTPPDFLIIGVPKGGTTSLLHWLGGHPRLWCHPRKELHFFNGAWEQGADWYCAQFPRFREGSGILRGEATPHYFLDPRVPERLAATAPHARLILLLRDPLQRAISWIEHLRRFEGLRGSTEQLLLAELAQLEADPDLISGERPAPPGAQALLGSCYDAPLARWQERHSERLLVLRSEVLFRTPEAALQECLAFLGLPLDGWPPSRRSPQNVNSQSQPVLSPNGERQLRDFLQGHNQWMGQSAKRHSAGPAPGAGPQN